MEEVLKIINNKKFDTRIKVDNLKIINFILRTKYTNGKA